MRALAVLVVALAGCGGEVVDIEIRFPSQETFLRSESARVFRFGVRPDQADLCPALLQETSLGQPSTEPDWDSGLIPVCDLHAGLSVPVEGAGRPARVGRRGHGRRRHGQFDRYHDRDRGVLARSAHERSGSSGTQRDGRRALD